MKKYYNKALIFEWFNSTKAIIALGMVLWAFQALNILESEIAQVKNSIAFEFNNGFTNNSLNYYFILAFIFIGIFYGSNGLNKKNRQIFLCSGPYTKKQIKINELLCMIITLAIFSIEYIYLMIMSFMKYRELMSIVNGYWTIMGIEILKVVCIGSGGILVMMILDMLFANSIVGMISIISVLPVSVLAILGEIAKIIHYIPKNLMEDITDYKFANSWIAKYPLFEVISIDNLDLKYILWNMMIILFVIAIIFVIFIAMEKRNKIETSTKIFASKKAENVVLGLVSALVGIISDNLLMDKLLFDKIAKQDSFNGYIYGTNLILVVGTEIIIILVFSIISFYVLKNIMKKIS